MNISCTFFLIFLTILITNGQDADVEKCVRSIINRGIIEYLCPPSSNGSRTLIRIYLRELKSECNNSKVLDATVLLTEYHEETTEMKLTQCPLPSSKIEDIMNNLNITNLKQLNFNLEDTTNITSNKERFMGLTDLEHFDLFQRNIFSLSDDHLDDNLPNLKELNKHNNSTDYTPYRLELWNNSIHRLESRVFDDLVDLKILNLSFNEIEVIEEDAFRNLSHIVNVSLNNNQLKQISRKIFMNCKNIEIIDMGKNMNVKLSNDVFSKFINLTEVNLAHDLLGTISGTLFDGSVNLRVVYLNHNQLKSLGKNLFKDLENLEKLHLHNNEIETLHPDIFSSLKNLKQLYLQNNLIKQINKSLLRNLKSLVEINLSYNKITSVHHESLNENLRLVKFSMNNNEYNPPENETAGMFFNPQSARSLEIVDLSYNKISEFPLVFRYIPTIKNINLRNNFIQTIKLVNLASIYSESNIKINLNSNNISSVLLDSNAINENISSKTVVKITGNPIICDCKALDLVRFVQQDHILKNYIWFEPRRIQCSGMVQGRNETLDKIKLEDLTCLLSRNCTKDSKCDCFRRSSDESLIIDCAKRELVDVPKLTKSELLKFNQTEVHLEGNRLMRSPGEYDNYSNITKLYLQDNEITNVTWLPASLKVLNLRNNALSSMPDKCLKILNESKLVKLSLGYNPWRCNCEAANFAEFITEHIKQIDSSDIRCEITGEQLLNLNKKVLCPTNTELILILSLSILALFLLLTIATSCYFKYKKKIGIWLYSRGLCLCLIKEEEIDEDKIYDAFICYSHKDQDFVTDNIISVLESGEQPYKLCVHVRDFVPGELIHSQILNSVRTSRRTIVILSSSFLESDWGILEFKTAQTEAMLEGMARVIIIIYGDIDLESLDDELKSYIKTNTYVEWGDSWFWKKLRYALPKRNRRSVLHSQKHANLMQYINEKFNFMKREPSITISTPPIILDPGEIEEKPFNSVA